MYWQMDSPIAELTCHFEIETMWTQLNHTGQTGAVLHTMHFLVPWKEMDSACISLSMSKKIGLTIMGCNIWITIYIKRISIILNNYWDWQCKIFLGSIRKKGWHSGSKTNFLMGKSSMLLCSSAKFSLCMFKGDYNLNRCWEGQLRWPRR